MALTCSRCNREILPGQNVIPITAADLNEQRIFAEGEVLFAHAEDCEPDVDPNAAFVAAVVDAHNGNQMLAPKPQYHVVTLEAVVRNEYRVLARDPRDAERLVQAGESRLIESVTRELTVISAVVDEDQKPDDF